MYTLHLSVYRRALVEEVGGWRPAFDGAQDHDLLLRLAERTDRVAHLPRTLYSWRAHAGSAALGDDAKPLAYGRAVAAIDQHLARLGRAAHAERLPVPGRFRVRYDAPALTDVAVVVPVPDDLASDPELASRVAAVVAAVGGGATDGPAVLVAVSPRTAHAAKALPGGVACMWAEVGEWGGLAAAAIAATTATSLVVLEDLCVPTTADWAAELLGPLQEPGVLASAALTLDPDGAVAQAGVVLVDGRPVLLHAGAAAGAADGPPDLTMVTDRSAAGGVLALRRTAVDYVPLDASLNRHALAELTARMTRGGGRVVCSPHAPWRITGAPRAAVSSLEELRRIAVADPARKDPFHNPRYWPDGGGQLVPRELQLTGRLREIDVLAGGADLD
jgi:hypothetical protein